MENFTPKTFEAGPNSETVRARGGLVRAFALAGALVGPAGIALAEDTERLAHCGDAEFTAIVTEVLQEQLPNTVEHAAASLIAYEAADSIDFDERATEESSEYHDAWMELAQIGSQVKLWSEECRINLEVFRALEDESSIAEAEEALEIITGLHERLSPNGFVNSAVGHLIDQRASELQRE
jgi:hypothetical protein